MKKRKVLFIDDSHQFLSQSLVKAGFECNFFPDYNYNDYLKVINDYQGVIIRSKIKLDKQFLRKAKNLKFIARVGAGMENIDLHTAQSLGIFCLNAPEGNRDAVGEQALGMLLSLLNNLSVADQEVRNGIWRRSKNRGIELGGKTIGLIGYGNTGSAFARKLSGLDVQVIAYDKYKEKYSDQFVEETTMEAVFDKSDILSLHVPLTDETHYMVDKNYLNRFSKKIFLINTSRGKVVKTADLVEHLTNGKVLGACLDVIEYEGPTFENFRSNDLPAEFRKIIKMNNVIFSPHIAGWTHESNFKMAKTIADKIEALLEKGVI